MKAPMITATLFFSVCGATLLYLVFSGPGHEYDFKLVVPIDTRQMPKAVEPPKVESQEAGTQPAAVTDGRAGEGAPPPVAERRKVSFGGRPGAASEIRSGD